MAQIVETFGNENQPEERLQTVNLVVSVDGQNDGYPGCTMWKTSVVHSEKEPVPGTWHWRP